MVLSVIVLALHVFEVSVFGMGHYFGGIVEKHSCGTIRKQVAEPVFTRVIYPLFDKNLSFYGIACLLAVYIHAAELKVIESLCGLAHLVLESSDRLPRVLDIGFSLRYFNNYIIYR